LGSKGRLHNTAYKSVAIQKEKKQQSGELQFSVRDGLEYTAPDIGQGK
jgi:hypothetical protein